MATFPCLSGSDDFEHQNTPGRIEICAFDNKTQQQNNKSSWMLFTNDNGLAFPNYKEPRTTEREASEDEKLASESSSNDSHKPLEILYPPHGALILTDKLQWAWTPSGSVAPGCNTCVSIHGAKNSKSWNYMEIKSTSCCVHSLCFYLTSC